MEKDVNNRKEIREKEELEARMKETSVEPEKSLTNRPIEYTIHDMVPAIKAWIATEKGYMNLIMSFIYMDVFEEVEEMDVDDLTSILEETAEYVLDTDAKELPLVNPDIIDYFFKCKYDFEQEKKLNLHKEKEEEPKAKEEVKKEKEGKKDESR